MKTEISPPPQISADADLEQALELAGWPNRVRNVEERWFRFIVAGRNVLSGIIVGLEPFHTKVSAFMLLTAPFTGTNSLASTM